MLLDVDPPPLGTLSVGGELRFMARDTRLSAQGIHVTGRFVIGSARHPFTRRAVITLTGPDAVLDAMGGTLEMHGLDRGAWTRLTQTAPAGACRLTLAPGLRPVPGDELALASTDFDCHQAETLRVTAVTGSTVTLARPLRSLHWGTVVDGVDERAEVALLSRNVVVQGGPLSAQTRQGGQVMVMSGSIAHLENVELRGMGQEGRVGRYPLHFHLAGEQCGSWVRGCAIHGCFNRALTIHGTQDLVVDNNAAFDTIGHAFFLEDGTETGNILTRNLAILTRAARPGHAVLASDYAPAAFWVTNPDNVLRGNAAAGSEHFGFWYDLPEHPTGLSRTPRTDKTVWPRRTPLGAFDGNCAHSNAQDGLFVDGSANPAGVYGAPEYTPRRRGPDGHTAPAAACFAGFTAFKNRRHGVWLRGSHLRLTGARLADNAIGATFAASDTDMDNSRVVGETENVGTPGPGEPVGAGGRSLPKPWEPDFPVRGFEFYDGLVNVRRTAFVHFQPSAVRNAGALSVLRFSPFFLDPRNGAEQLTFVDANRVQFDPPRPATNPKLGGDGARSALFVDRDGSVCGTAGASVTVAQPTLLAAGARHVPGWNACVSPARYGRLFLDNKDVHPAGAGPVTLTRTDSGASLALWGTPADGDGPNASFQANAVTGKVYAARFARQGPHVLRLTLRHRLPGDWIVVQVPAPGPVSVTDGGRPVPAVTSDAALRACSTSAYRADGKIVWVKLVVRQATLGSATVTIRRQ